MQFKRMVAGLSAAAIAVTQTALVPIDIFAATNKPVNTLDTGFSLKLTSKNQTGYSYDGDYVYATDNKAVLNAKKIKADGANTDLAFSYGGDINNGASNKGDQYTFTAQGLNITATTKGSSTPESSKSLWSGSVDLDEVLEAGVIDILNAGSAGDIINISYSAAVGCAIRLTDSEGNEITPDSDENEILTFKLTDKSASLFHIMGDKVFVNSVDVTSINELTKDILYTIGTLTMNTNVPSGSAAGDTAILYYTDVEPEEGVPEDIAVEGAADGVNENGTYTFTLTEDMVKNGLTVSGNGHRISSCTVKHKKTTDLGKRGPIDDIKSSATVDAAQFADAAANNSLKITFTVNADKTNPEFIVASGHSNLSRAVPSADDAYHTFLLDESAVNSIKENGISISGNDVTITGVELVTPQTDVPAESVTLFSSDEPVVWSQTWMDGYWDGEQAIDTTSISDSIGTIDAFNQNYDNITATWVSLSATKLVLDEGELWVGENTLGNWGSWVSVGKTDVKKGGKIIVAYKDAKNAQIMLKKSDYTEFAGSPGSASNIKNGKGTVTFDLDEAAAAEISANGFVLGGKDASVTSVKYEAPAETKIAIDTKNFPDANFRNLLKTYSTDGKTLSESDIAKITALGVKESEKTIFEKVTNLSGIEYLTSLRELNIEGNTKITALDLSQNDSLIQLDAAHCTKLASVKLPAGITTVRLSNTAISEFDTSAMTELLDLAVSGTKLTSLDVSKNTKLEVLSIAYTGINSIDLTANTELKELYVSGCGLTKLDLSNNTKLLTLYASNNSLTSLDLTGLNKLETIQVNGNVRNIGTVVDGEFDLSTVIDNFDVSKISDVVGAEMDENGKLTGITTDKVTYSYSTGLTAKGRDKVTFTLAPEKLVTVYFYVGKMGSDDEEDDDLVPFEKWDDVVKYINTANDSKASYVIGVDKDVTIDKFTFPAASKAKEIYISSYGESTQTITTKAATIALPTTVGFTDINVKSTAKTFTMSASKDLALDNAETNLTAIKGAAKSTLTLDCPHASISDITADVSGFGTIQADGTTKFSNTVKATNLVLGSGSTVYFTNTASATFTNIKSEEKSNPGYIQYIKNDDGYKQITVTGEILNPVYIGLADEEGRLLPFAEKDTVLTAKTADFTNILITGGAPEGTTLARVGSDIKVLPIAMTLKYTINVNNVEIQFAQWSDVLSTIAANAKAGNKDIDYLVILTNDLDINGAFKMPAAKTFDKLTFISHNDEKPNKINTITFTGNIALTGNTIFQKVQLDSVKKVNGANTSVDFTIAAGKNELTLNGVKTPKSIKSITSSGIVNLSNVTVNTVNAAIIGIASEGYLDSYYLQSLNSDATSETAWEGKPIENTSVTVTGNLTAKTYLYFIDEKASLTVKGILNTVQIKTEPVLTEDGDCVLVVYRQANNRNPLVIGKNGFGSDSKQIKFILADPETDKTAQITEKTVIGTIAGPYADQLAPSDDNLAENDSYYIIKDGRNLIAVPKVDSESNKYLVEVNVNGRTAYYKTLDEAIKDINATGTKTTDYVIKLTPEMFEGKTLAKLPLPSAGKYSSLYYAAESDININITSDLALTGDLIFSTKITLNKVNKKDGSVQPINISLGKYGLTIFNVISADHSNGEAFAPSSMIGNITGTGSINMNSNIVISGKVAKTVTFYAHDASIILEGAMSAFEGTITAPSSSSTAIFTYDKSNVKNVKFQNIAGFSKFTLAYRGEDEIAEGDIIASIAGDYSDKNTVTAGSTELVVVRSGNNLKAVNKNDVLTVQEYSGALFDTDDDEEPILIATRSYDTFANAVKDIERIKNPIGLYAVYAHKGDVLVLPKAKTYDTLMVASTEGATESYAITTAKDLTLTGNLALTNINLDKVVKDTVQPMSINLGNYKFMAYNSHVSYDADNKVSRLTNINGINGTFGLMDNMTVSGKVNVGTFAVNSVVTFGEKAGFAAATEIIVGEGFDGNDPEFIYPLKAAKNIDLSNIDTGKGFDITVEGAKEGDQVAAVKGDMIRHDIKLNDEEFIIVRSGNKLIAAKDDTEYTLYAPDQSIRLFDTYDNAVAYITKLNNANGIYELTLPQSADNIELKKLTLPTKGKYSGLSITASNTDGTTIIVNSDIALTGDLALKGDLTLMKDGEKLLKITSPLDSKTKQPLYQFTLVDYANVVNGTFNGTPIETPEVEKTVIEATLPYSSDGGVDLAENILKFGATKVVKKGTILVTFKDTATFALYDADGNLLANASNTGNGYANFNLTDDQAAKITAGGFTVSGKKGIVTGVKYSAPPVTVTEPQIIGFTDASLDLSEYVIDISEANVAENGVITVIFKEHVANEITLRYHNYTVLAKKTLADGATSLTFTLTAYQASEITANGFYINGDAGVVTSVTYTEPTPVNPGKKSAYVGSLNYNGDEIDLSRFVLWINKKAVVENGTITVTLKEEVTSSVIFKKTNETDVIKTVAPTSGSTTYTWVLSADDAAYIAENGFVIDGTEGVLTSVTYTAPTTSEVVGEVKDTEDGSLNFSGSVDLAKKALKISAKSDAVEYGSIKVIFNDVVSNPIMFKDASQSKILSVDSSSSSRIYRWVLSAEDAAYIAENGFVIDGTAGVIIDVTYTAPLSSDTGDSGSQG